MKTIGQRVRDHLQCPACGGFLQESGQGFACTEAGCAARYPVVDTIPVLIDEGTSVFSTSDFLSRKETFFREPTALSKAVRAVLPELGRNVAAQENYPQFFAALRKANAHPIVLIVGGSIAGEGLSGYLDSEDVEFVETDVAFGPRTMFICDCHSLPFASGSFDGVIVQAVLEHVMDPHKCVQEICRVLRDGGLVYAETPFMQQLHGEPYDFTRFTVIGHRWLFRDFQEISSGACCGPGMALAWSVQYFFLSFCSSRFARRAVKALCQLLLFWLVYLDRYLITKPGAIAAASGLYFMGSKSAVALGRPELLARYRRPAA